MPDSLKVADIIPARPREVYSAWLDAKKHTLMTGAPATDEGGGRFTAWDGYISGRTLKKQAGAKIVQSWRTSHFADSAPDSIVTVELEPFDGGTHVTLVHENIPDEQGDSYRDGWHQHYFAPMKAYFGALAKKKPAKKRPLSRKRVGVRAATSKPSTKKLTAKKKTVAKKSPAKKKR